MADDPRNRRSYLDDDDDDDSSRTSPFYYDDEEDDDDDSLYSGYSSPSYGSSRSGSGSGSSASGYGSSGGSLYGSSSGGSSGSSRYNYKADDDSASEKSSYSDRTARPKDSSRTANPRPERGKSRFDRDKKSSGSTNSLTNRFNALRKRLPGSGKDSSSAGSSTSSSGYGSSASGSSTPASTSRSPFNRNRASNVRTVGGSSSSPASTSSGSKSGEKKGGLLGGLSNPFSRSGSKSGQQSGSSRDSRSSGGSSSSKRDRPKSTPNRVKKARSLPSDQKRPRVASQGISLDRKLDIAGIAMIIVAAIIFFGAVSGNEGDASGFILHLLYQLVGIGWFGVPLALGGTGLWLILRHFGERAPTVDPLKIAGWVVMFVGAIVTAHYIHLLGRPVTTVDQLRFFSDEAAQAGYGGGWLGGQIYMFFIANIGDLGTVFALLGWWFIALIMATDLSVADFIGVFVTFSRRIQTRRKVVQAERGSTRRGLASGDSAATGAGGDLAELTPAQRSAALEQPVQQALPERSTAADARALRASDTLSLPRSGQQATVVQTASSSAGATPRTEGAVGSRSPSAIDLNRQGVTRIRRAYSPADEFTDDEDDDAAADLSASESRFRPPVVQTPVAPPPPASPPASPQVDNLDEDDEDDGVIDAYPATASRFYTPPTPRPTYGGLDDEDEEEDDEDDALTAAAVVEAAFGAAADSSDDQDKGDGTDESFFKPAQPRDPERAQQRLQMRQRGTGLSPAERAALLGQFAGGDDDDKDEGEIDFAASEDDDYEDETTYEDVADPALTADDLPSIELDAFEDEDDEDDDVGWHIPAASVEDEDDEDEDEGDGLPPRSDVSWQELRDRASGAGPRPQPSSTVQASPPPSTTSATEARSTINEYRPATATGPARPAASETAQRAVASTAEEDDPDVAITTVGQVWDVPDFTDVLEPSSEQSIDDDVLLERARIIEDTLGSFGAPGKVVEVNPGPAITQFGVEPDYVEGRGGKRTRVKVQAIARLADDLALSLAARSIRIEAPVPGKGFVGIEVPNTEVALVSLYDVMESREFKKVRQKSKLAIGLGQSVDGTPVAADLTAMPHLLIAGTTGSGKSVCVNAIISCLLLQNTPDEMRLIMVDPKRVELTGYNGIPHLVAPVVVELERIVGVLKWVTREMDERYKKFNQATARNIADFNSRIGKDILDEKPLPYLVIIIDELADLMMLAPDETERVITRLAQMARATGIHLIISTQRPSVDVVTGLIKANFPSRVAFAVASSVDSRVILDQPGAERLLGRGDMLFQAPDAAAPARLQGVYVSDEELNRLVRYWKGVRTVNDRPVARPTERDTSEKAATISTMVNRIGAPGKLAGEGGNPWDRMVPLKPKAETEDVDELYDEAVEVVRALKKASVSLLQRQLRIGYTRAARLIDIMEERGVVGPPTSGSKPRKVIGYSDDADFDDLDDE